MQVLTPQSILPVNQERGSKLYLNKCYIQAVDFLCLLKISGVIKKLFILLS